MTGTHGFYGIAFLIQAMVFLILSQTSGILSLADETSRFGSYNSAGFMARVLDLKSSETQGPTGSSEGIWYSRVRVLAHHKLHGDAGQAPVGFLSGGADNRRQL